MDQPTPTARDAMDRVMKPFALPLGLASPMWLVYGAAVGVGATWWWMSRMGRFIAPHVEAPVDVEAVAVEPPFAPIPETRPASIETPPVAAIQQPVTAPPEPIHTPTEAAIERPDELTLLRGVGPRVADALVARGVTTFAQLAAWTDADLAAFDGELKLLGRSKRYDFLGQARELAAQR